MKTKDVIARLQKADPSGELECCINNIDISHIDTLPAYYDGYLEVLMRDEYDRVVGAKYVGSGKKVFIGTYTIEDVIFDHDDLPIYYEGLSAYREDILRKNIDQQRLENNEFHDERERGYFINHVLRRVNCQEIMKSEDEVKEIAKRFYNLNLSYKDKLPTNLASKVSTSWLDRRNMQWDQEINVYIEDHDVIISKLDKVGY